MVGVVITELQYIAEAVWWLVSGTHVIFADLKFTALTRREVYYFMMKKLQEFPEKKRVKIIVLAVGVV